MKKKEPTPIQIPWNALMNQTSSVQSNLIRKNVGIQNNTASQSGFDLEVEKLNAIRAKTSRGFKPYLVKPGLLPRADFFCVYDDNVLKDYVGADVIFDGSTNKYDNIGSPVNGNPVQVPYWRTVVLQVEGTFLKFEWAPIRKNFGRNFEFTDSQFQNVVPPNDEPDNTIPNTSDPTSTTVYDPGAQVASEPVVLIEFENPQGKPIVVKDGDVFDSYFTTIYITFKEFAPNFILTVGFNSQLISKDNKPTSLHLWGLQGLKDDTVLRPKHFCITDKEVTGATTYTGISVAQNQNFNSSSLIQNLIPSKASGALIPKGSVVGWLTGFNCHMFQPGYTGVGDKDFLDVDIMVARIDATGGWKAWTEKLMSCHMNTYIQNWYTWSGEPIRFQLATNEAIFIRWYRPTTTYTVQFLKFALEGYVLGGITSAFGGYTPFDSKFLVTEAPYGCDLDRYLAPHI